MPRSAAVAEGVESLKTGAQLLRWHANGKPVPTFVRLLNDEATLHLQPKGKGRRKAAAETAKLAAVIDLFCGEDTDIGAENGLSLSLWLLPTDIHEMGQKVDVIFDDAEVFGLWVVALRALLAEIRPQAPEEPSVEAPDAGASSP